MDNALLGMLVILAIVAFALAGGLVVGFVGALISLGSVILLRAVWFRREQRAAIVASAAPRDGDSKRR